MVAIVTATGVVREALVRVARARAVYTGGMKVQRVRITFSRGDDLKYITHLDLMRAWERALRRAEVPIAYSEGFSPHAQISLAAPLAVGTTGDAELMDVFLAERIAPKEVLRLLAPQLPAGLHARSAVEVGLGLPALQAEVRSAEYMVDVPCDGAAGCVADGETVEEAVAGFLAAESIPWEHRREDEVRSYDIRALVRTIEVVERTAEVVRLSMRLKNDSSGSGRPEQVVAALGLPAPVRIHRTRLVLAETSPSREAWRRRGRFSG
jgi:radical SAM-linked protein